VGSDSRPRLVQPVRRLDVEEVLPRLLVGVVGPFAQQGIPVDVLRKIAIDAVSGRDFWEALVRAEPRPAKRELEPVTT